MTYIDLTGQRFGRLTVLRREGTVYSGDSARVLWRCRCDCGEECDVASIHLRRGYTRSCGCLRREHCANISRQPRKRRSA